MKKTLIALSLASAVAGTASANILIAGWEFSNLKSPQATNGVGDPIRILANMSDLYVGDGEAIDGPSGTLFIDGSFGSTRIENPFSDSVSRLAGNLSLNLDVLTDTRPTATDFNPPGGGVDGSGLTLLLSDGSFEGIPAQDPAGATIVFGAFAPAGFMFDAGDYTFSFAAAATPGYPGTEIGRSYSTNGSDFTDLATQTVPGTGIDFLGTPITVSLSGGETAIFYGLTLPSEPFGFNNFYIDNVQIIGPGVTVIPEPSALVGLFGAIALVGMVTRRRRA
jgi:hypothetical protein